MGLRQRRRQQRLLPGDQASLALHYAQKAGIAAQPFGPVELRRVRHQGRHGIATQAAIERQAQLRLVGGDLFQPLASLGQLGLEAHQLTAPDRSDRLAACRVVALSAGQLEVGVEHLPLGVEPQQQQEVTGHRER